MALTISGNFAGIEAAGYIYPALLTGNTLGQGLVTVHENVDYKLNVRGITSQGEILRNSTCDFSDYGAVTIADTVLEPKELQVNMQLCVKTFRSEWESLKMRGNILDQELPPEFLDFFVDRQLAKVAQGVETAIWQGTAGANGSFAGLEAALAADGTVNDVGIGAVVIGADTIIAQLGRVRDAIPASVYGKEDFSILIPISIQKYYIAAQAALGYQNLYHDGVTGLNFEGIPLKVANGLSDDKMVACRTSDLHFGTNLLTDMGPELRVLNMAELDGSDNVRFILKFTAGTINTNGADIVYYS
tara:strand:+ start:514 stop:1419 length:906 start_codon:yes stop_codon:yes gene_type:complete